MGANMNTFRNWFTKRPATRNSSSARLHMERLEARWVPSAPPGGLNDPVITAVADAEFKQDRAN